MGARARERVLDEHTYAHRARQVLRLLGLEAAVRGMSGPRIVAVVPAFQEEAAIGGVVEEIRRFDPAIDVVVVDDGSGDATAEAAAAAGATVVRLPFNLGIGGAVQTGFRWALERDYDLAVRLDGDGQHDPAELPKLLAPLERGEADVVTGSRFRGRATTRIGRRSARRLGITLVRAARLAALRPAGDRHDLRLPGAQPAGDRALCRDYPSDYPEVEATVLVLKHRLRLVEVPVRMREREHGSSSITFLRSVYYAIKVTLALLVAMAPALRRPSEERSRDPGSDLDRRRDRLACSSS